MVRKCGSACEFRNPETILKFRLHVGERWQCLFEDKVKREYRVLEPEWIEVPAGRFKCIRLDRKDEGNPNTTRLWYASGVGLIKSVEADTVRELVEFGIEEFDTDEDE